MVSAGPIGFTIVFLVLSLMAVSILVAWILKGAGKPQKRKKIGVVLFIAIIVCWMIFIAVGAQSNTGLIALFVGILISIFCLFVPALFRKNVESSQDT